MSSPGPLLVPFPLTHIWKDLFILTWGWGSSEKVLHCPMWGLLGQEVGLQATGWGDTTLWTGSCMWGGDDVSFTA